MDKRRVGSPIPHQTGFTLIELMVVLAIVAILTAVALPAYKDYVRRAHAADAVSQMASWATRMEQYYLDNRTYGAGACGLTAPTVEGYALACATTNGGQGYKMTATSVGTSDGTYDLSEGGQKHTSVFKGNSVDKYCWLLKGSEC